MLANEVIDSRCGLDMIVDMADALELSDYQAINILLWQLREVMMATERDKLMIAVERQRKLREAARKLGEEIRSEKEKAIPIGETGPSTRQSQ